MSLGAKDGAPVRFKSGGETAGRVGESEVVGGCRTEEIEGDSRCGFGDTMGDGAPTSGGTTAECDADGLVGVPLRLRS